MPHSQKLSNWSNCFSNFHAKLLWNRIVGDPQPQHLSEIPFGLKYFPVLLVQFKSFEIYVCMWAISIHREGGHKSTLAFLVIHICGRQQPTQVYNCSLLCITGFVPRASQIPCGELINVQKFKIPLHHYSSDQRSDVRRSMHKGNLKKNSPRRTAREKCPNT